MKSDIIPVNEDWQQRRCLQQAKFERLLYAALYACDENNLG